MIKYAIFLLLMLPMVFANEEYYVITMNYSSAGFSVTNVAVKPLDFIPAPYPEGGYKIEVRKVDNSIAASQSFELPQMGYIHDTITDKGIKGEFSEQDSILLDFYLPYDAKAKDIVIVDDKGNTRAAIDVTPLSALTAEEKETIKQEKQQTAQSARLQEMLVPFGLLIIILLAGAYWWRRQR